MDLGARHIEYSVLKGTSRRYTYFRIRSDMTLEVVLPRGRKVDVEREIRAKATWLQREYNHLSETKAVLTPDTVLYDGKILRLVFSEGLREELVPSLEEGKVRAQTTDGRMLLELVRRWFLRESSAYVVRKVAELAPKVGVRPSRVDVREISKWGYCTRRGRLSFSWQLIALPERLREYVVLHELTHLLEFNHSGGFKAKLARLCPDFLEREKELDFVAPCDMPRSSPAWPQVRRNPPKVGSTRITC